MTRILLDTSAYSAFMQDHALVKAAVQRADEIYFNPIVLGELRAGFARGKHFNKNQEELEEFLNSPRVRIINLDEETSRCYALILNYLWRTGKPIPTNDVWIAAGAMQHGLGILTTDSHFKNVPQVATDYSPR